ncbi:MAG: L,D-transpeptidase family protein, partial [Methyloceanibacter sp.]
MLRSLCMTVDQAAVARGALSSITVCLGVAALLGAAAIGTPLEAKKRQKTSAEEVVAGPDADQPMTLIVSLSNQKVDIYRGTTLITTSSVSTGMRGYSTKPGVFSILEKKRHHYSNLYNGAPMPWMQRLTWSGTALHAGVVPGYPASHGCVRLRYSFAPKLFQMTTVGQHVIVARDRVAPELIEHVKLFQPLPPPAPPNLVKTEHPQRQSSNETAPAPISVSPLPVVLAKADIGDVATDAPDIEIPSSTPVSAETAPNHASTTDGSAETATTASRKPGEDTNTHAIDPTAGPSGQTALRAAPVLLLSSSKNQARLKPVLSNHGVALSPLLNAKGAGESEAAKPQAAIAESVPVAATDAPAQALPVAVSTPLDAPASAPVAEMAEPAVAVSAEATSNDSEETQPDLPAAEPLAEAIADETHPPIPQLKPSVIAAKIQSGSAAAALEAAEPRSTAPLRILVTRRTERDRMIDVQHELASLGYLEAQEFDGTFGKQTVTAIKAFQKANGLPETGAFTEELVK